MDKEQQDYILRYSSHFMTKDEKIAWRHYSTHYKHEIAFDKENPRYKLYLQMGWITEDPRVLKLLDDGIEAFCEKTASRILKESGLEIVFNCCPKCYKLTRTPLAKQCPHCFHDWHTIEKVKEEVWIVSFYQRLAKTFLSIFN